MNTPERNATPDLAVLLQTLRALPQARHFTAQQAAGWLTQMQARQAEGASGGLPLVGHVRRLGGFGASEIGLLVANGAVAIHPSAPLAKWWPANSSSGCPIPATPTRAVAS